MKLCHFITILMLSICCVLLFTETVAQQDIDYDKLLIILENDQKLRDLFLDLANNKANNTEKLNEFTERLRTKAYGNEEQYTLCKFKICNMGTKRRTRST